MLKYSIFIMFVFMISCEKEIKEKVKSNTTYVTYYLSTMNFENCTQPDATDCNASTLSGFSEKGYLYLSEKSCNSDISSISEGALATNKDSFSCSETPCGPKFLRSGFSTESITVKTLTARVFIDTNVNESLDNGEPYVCVDNITSAYFTNSTDWTDFNGSF